MPNLEYDVDHTLVTPYATVDINAASGYRYMVQPDSYKIVPSLRVVSQNISQADGSVLNPRWKTGLVAQMQVALDVASLAGGEMTPACADDLRFMAEQLVGALNSITRLGDTPQRLTWQPSGYGDRRMLTDIQVLGWPDPSYDLNGTEALIEFAVETPFPYAVDATETTTAIADGASAGETLVNLGNAAFSPVFKVYGPSTGFTIRNYDDEDADGNPKEIVYDSTRDGAVAIGALQYAEIDCFRRTIILNGDVTDLIAGLDPEMTDFFTLTPQNIAPLGNRVTITGANCDALYSNAWA